jgi:hypothetical protein
LRTIDDDIRLMSVDLDHWQNLMLMVASDWWSIIDNDCWTVLSNINVKMIDHKYDDYMITIDDDWCWNDWGRWWYQIDEIKDWQYLMLMVDNDWRLTIDDNCWTETIIAHNWWLLMWIAGQWLMTNIWWYTISIDDS